MVKVCRKTLSTPSAFCAGGTEPDFAKTVDIEKGQAGRIEIIGRLGAVGTQQPDRRLVAAYYLVEELWLGHAPA